MKTKIPTDFIEEYLEQEGITVLELAKISGVLRSRIQTAMRHTHDLKESDARKLAEVIGCDYKRLMTAKGQRHFNVEDSAHFRIKNNA